MLRMDSGSKCTWNNSSIKKKIKTKQSFAGWRWRGRDSWLLIYCWRSEHSQLFSCTTCRVSHKLFDMTITFYFLCSWCACGEKITGEIFQPEDVKPMLAQYRLIQILHSIRSGVKSSLWQNFWLILVEELNRWSAQSKCITVEGK